MTEAFIFVNCFLTMAGAVEGVAKMTEGVSGAYITTGINDVILKIKVQDHKLKDVIQKVKGIPGVAGMITGIITK
jgi:hypothetical protein